MALPKQDTQKDKNNLKYLLSIVLAWTLLMVVVLSAQAATSGTAEFNCLQLSVTSGGEVTVEATTTGFKIVAYGTDGSCNSTSTETVTCTITNTSTKSDGSVRAVSFKITTSGMNSNASNESKTLDSSTTSLTYTGTSGKGASASTTLTITITGIELESTGTTVTTTVKPGTGGNITVDGTAVTAQTDFSNLDDHTYTLTATASSGYEFFGWMSSGGPINTNGSASVSYAGKNTATVWPLFVKTGSAIYYIQGASPVIYYGYLDDAVTAAGTSGTIVPYRGGTVYGASSNTITLSGQTLLLPISATDLTVDTATSTDDSGNLASTWQYANVAFTSDQYDDGNSSNSSVTGVLEPNTSVYLTLTIPSGTTVNVNSGSKLVIGGTIVSGTSNTGGVCGATAGAHSNLVVNGVLNINSGGVLSACGYVLGSGNVNIVGGSAYQPFVLMDYHDGHYTANSTKNGNFPAYRYILQNIRPEITISSSGKMYGYIDIYTQETNVYVTTIKARHNVDCQLIIGTSSDTQCLIHLADGATLTATYDSTDYVTTTSGKAGSAYYSKAGKTHLTINGGATMGYLSISVYVPIIGAQTAASNSTDFPVPYHYDITLKNGDYDIPYNLVLFPGASLTVAEDADLVVSANKFVVLDGLHDHSSRSSSITVGSWYEYHYPSTANFQSAGYNGTANFIVDGTFTVNSGASFGGYIQTNGTGTVTINGTASATAGVGNVNTYGTPVNEHVGRTEHTLSAWLWEADGDLVAMTAGTTYYGVDANSHTIAEYAYEVYTEPNATTTTPNTETLNASIIGSWCTVDGHNEDTAVEENCVEATCGKAGSYDSVVYCTACGTELSRTKQTLSATGNHSYGNVTYTWGDNYSSCTAKQECVTCGNIQEATATVNTETVDATCNSAGSKTYTATFEESWASTQEKMEEINQLSHTPGAAVKENETDTSYDSVVKCSVCGEEISRETISKITYSVTISWTDLDYVFKPEYTWNPTNLRYEVSGGTWSEAGSVTIQNGSNVPVWYTISAATETNLGWTPTIELTHTSGEIAAEGSLTSTIKVDGDPYTDGAMLLTTDAQQIGTITITLSKEDNST